MNPKLCKAGIQLREQIDDDYPNRDRRSDGWVADARHVAKGNSDHIPDPKSGGLVRAIDIDADLGAHKEEAYALVEKLRKLAKRGDKRIKYIIFDGKIMSPIFNWKRRKYTGANPHHSHIHISFTSLGDKNGDWFDLEGERNALRSTKGSRKLGQDILSGGPSDLPSSGTGLGSHCKCCSRRNNPIDHQLA